MITNNFKILTIFSSRPNPVVKVLPSVAGTLRDKAPRSAPYLER